MVFFFRFAFRFAITRLHFLLFFDIAVEAVVFIDLVINIHREFVHSFVVST